MKSLYGVKNLVIDGWELLRKPTTPIHWLYGVFCAFLIYSFGILAGLVMILLFMLWQYWNDKNEGKREGHWDWWESSVTFCLSFFVLGILQSAGVVSITWL